VKKKASRFDEEVEREWKWFLCWTFALPGPFSPFRMVKAVASDDRLLLRCVCAFWVWSMGAAVGVRRAGRK
jgi:hypothetical protein